MIGSNDKELRQDLQSVLVAYLERGMIDELHEDIVIVLTEELEMRQEHIQTFANACKRFESA